MVKVLFGLRRPSGVFNGLLFFGGAFALRHTAVCLVFLERVEITQKAPPLIRQLTDVQQGGAVQIISS
jgi:hypothetical protein